MGALQIGGTLVVLYFLYSGFKLFQNYRKVRNTGFAIFWTPIDPTSPLTIMLTPLLLPICKRFLPFALWRPIDLCCYGLEFRDYVAGRTKPTTYWLLGPSSKLELFTEDPEIANAVLTRRRDFLMDEVAMKFMNVVGKNLLASEGDDWARQRRLIAPMLNERIMDTVWKESSEQACDMLSSFMAEGGRTTGTVEGLRRIAFNVLQSIGYGMPQGWNESKKEPPTGHKMVYMDALHELIEGFILIAIVRSSKFLKMPFFPEVLRRKGYALEEFIVYTQELLHKEREAGLESDRPRNSLLSLLATISEDSAKGKLTGVPPGEKQTLSDDEITGNLYQFTLAGFDTTANTLAYAVTTLAIVPKWQDWIIEEIDEVQKSIGDSQADYTVVFPKLQRCLALMFETLRIYTPVAHIMRECYTEQTVTSNGKTYHIPGGTRITNVFQGIHTLQPTVWGDDCAEYLPSRWLDASSTTAPPVSTGSMTPAPALKQPPGKGAFMPWSAGPRLCPGMKMAQVEFLAVIWSIFSRYRVDAAVLDGENKEQARNRLHGVMMDSRPRLTLQMNRPQDAIMTWTKREK